METMREKAAQMLRESEVVVLTSVNKEGDCMYVQVS